MTEWLLIAFISIVFANVILAGWATWRDREGEFFFTRLHKRYGERYAISVMAAVGLTFLLAVIFEWATVVKVALSIIDAALAFLLYRDVRKAAS